MGSIAVCRGGAGAASAKQNAGPKPDIAAKDATRTIDVLRTMIADCAPSVLLEVVYDISRNGIDAFTTTIRFLAHFQKGLMDVLSGSGINECT